MYDIYCYSSLDNYMARYKPYITEPTRHIEIDAFYVKSDQLIFTLLNDKIDVKRPRLDSHICLIQHMMIDKHIDPLKYHKVTYRDTFYLPESNKIGFIQQGFFRKSYKYLINVSRFLGTKPTKCHNISYNWFFDSEQKRLNFVLSSS